MGPHELLEKVVAVFERLGVPYLVTGSVAAMAYGEPRLTNDIDIVAAVEKRHIPELLKSFPVEDFYLSDVAAEEAVLFQRQFNIIHPASGFKVDVIIKRNSEFDNSRFGRVKGLYPAASFQANFASPEDDIIKKMEYYRDGMSEKQLRDIAGILRISGTEIDGD